MSLITDRSISGHVTTKAPLFFSRFFFPILICFSTLAHCMPFGAPDSRSAAMGKTGVASAGSANAAYFNPALLAAFSQRKHLGGNQRIALPTLSAFISDSILELEKLDNADYKNRVESARVDYNNNLNTEALINTLTSLAGDLSNTSSNPLLLDAQANIIFRIPDRQEGGAFTLSRRGLMDGYLDYTAADAALLSDYLEELDFVNNGGAPATLHPELYTDGQLNNPKDDLTSSAETVVLIIEEIALSMGWAVTWWDVDMLIGVTPKIMRVSTQEYAANSDGLTREGTYDDGVNLNVDLGWAKQINDQLSFGLTVKNLIPMKYRTESNRSVELEPQLRFGSAYQSKWGEYTLDLDLIGSDPLFNGDPTQELGVGGEWTLWNQQIRAGLVTNLKASGQNASPLYTFGFHLQLGAYYSDFTYGSGKHQKAAALQFGLRF